MGSAPACRSRFVARPRREQQHCQNDRQTQVPEYPSFLGSCGGCWRTGRRLQWHAAARRLPPGARCQTRRPPSPMPRRSQSRSPRGGTKQHRLQRQRDERGKAGTSGVPRSRAAAPRDRPCLQHATHLLPAHAGSVTTGKRRSLRPHRAAPCTWRQRPWPASRRRWLSAWLRLWRPPRSRSAWRPGCARSAHA